MSLQDFHGAKIALICGAHLVAYKRDQKAGIPYPGKCDLPGGGREGSETVEECACREVMEEFGIAVDPARILWSRPYPGSAGSGMTSYFLVAEITSSDVEAISFGEEGERWELMLIQTFLDHPDAVRSLQHRLTDFMSDQPNRRLDAGDLGLRA